MPGPVPDYPSRAAHQRAYRQRQRAAAQAEAEAAEIVSLYAHVLQAAITAACKQGAAGAWARALYRPDPFDTLRAVADHFYDVAGVPASQRPWRPEHAERAPAATARGTTPAAPDSAQGGNPLNR